MFFKYRVNTFLFMCGSRDRRLVISSSYHTYILFIFNPFFYNIMYLFWLATSYNCPSSWFKCGHTIDDLGTHFFQCLYGSKCTIAHNTLQDIVVAIDWRVEHMFRRRFPTFSFTTPNDEWVSLSLVTIFGL
jgi:hypothetical protein